MNKIWIVTGNSSHGSELIRGFKTEERAIAFINDNDALADQYELGLSVTAVEVEEPGFKEYLNEQGRRCWDLHSIFDIALLPDECIEDALEQLHMLILQTRLLLAADTTGQLRNNLHNHITYVDDGEHSSKLRSGEDELMKITKYLDATEITIQL